MTAFGFRTSHANGHARLGWFTTPHGVVETPAFMPVGTHASVRGLAMQEIRDAGAQMILANAYHLYLRPGDQMVRALGGLHAFSRWEGPMLTDSGGYQVFSLARYRKVSEEGVEFRNKIDGSLHQYTPEKVMQIERNIGADVIMQLDELIEGGSEHRASYRAMERSLRWLERCRVEFERLDRDGRAPVRGLTVPDGAPALSTQDMTRDVVAPPQALFPIVQGGTYADLRTASINGILQSGDWAGIAVGGLSVGEAKSAMYDTFDTCAPLLPLDKPRYLMGVGFPDDLLEAVSRGMDLFDCVAPTRMGRHGTVFTSDGKVQIQKSSNRTDRRPLTDDCACPACMQYDRAYLRHLMVTEEPLGPRLLALHNLTFLMALMAKAREQLAAGEFGAWSSGWLSRYRSKGMG
ncbi:tRNA guanosine(34) transglycosylase Tgt [Gemmatimonas phototrophica]|uniref:Queuine tRNA-ribosyltransferase n=1 Tax=Gemmatimonas phototrophica TaxID=1379270 RepID=A0A143BLC1_9BACT|nr:tRNA guanosine(34) transglycosylase Tgt [Gemmatimonas phototrophica]AMW05808.1 queuine tRNA-ribosyltransferase [Gemmatimonas phototrophica]